MSAGARTGTTRSEAPRSEAPPPYAELVAATNFSFLRGASHPGDMVLAALALGQTGIGIADRNTVAGVVRAHAALEDLRAEDAPAAADCDPGPREALRENARKFRLAVGARLALADGAPDVVAYPVDRGGWGRLCRLLSLGKGRARKGDCVLHLDDLLADAGGLLLIVVPGRRHDGLDAVLGRVAEAAPGAA